MIGTRARAVVGAAMMSTGALSAPAMAESAVARGEYLTTIMACTDCHTPGTFLGAPDFSLYLAGGDVGFHIPGLGIFYPKNLTPDPEHGLGAWSDTEIIAAIREGRGRDGRELVPSMPWRQYTGLTDEDAAAIVAFLRSLPPTPRQVPADVAAGGTADAPYLTVAVPEG